MKEGDPLPGDGPFTVYRGVSGRGAKRRVRGISWTDSIEQAKWFAIRFPFENPAVFKIVVDKSAVYAYSTGESEFLCDISPNLKLKKVWPLKGMEVERPNAEAYGDYKLFLSILR